MSHMSNKDIEKSIEFADKWCKECGMPYWTGTEDGFCSESCKELYEYDQEMEAWRKSKINEMSIEELINNPLEALEPILKEHTKETNLRNNKTRSLPFK